MRRFEIVVCIWFLIFLQIAIAADDQYKPYLHKPAVPEHPKVRLYGNYKTNLFPGAATYTYSITVPKGTNALTPTLAISYNSQTVKQRPSILGAGWQLTQNLIYRDVNSTVNESTPFSFSPPKTRIPIFQPRICPVMPLDFVPIRVASPLLP